MLPVVQIHWRLMADSDKHSRCLKAILKKKLKPTLLDLGWLLVHMRFSSFVALLAVLFYLSFISRYDCQHFLSVPSYFGEINSFLA